MSAKKLTRWELEALENWIGLVPPGDERVCTDIYRLIAHVRAQDEALRGVGTRCRASDRGQIPVGHICGCCVANGEIARAARMAE